VVISVVALAPPAACAASTDLGPIGLGTILVDNAREHVLVSGPTANVVDVLSFSGNLIATIPNIYGAYGMAIKGRSLYVAERTDGSVVKINLATLKTSKKPLVTGLQQPTWLAITGGALWITTSVGSSGRGDLASVNLSSHVLTKFETSYYEPDLATSPADANTLFVASDGLSPGSIYRLDVSSGTPVIAVSGTGLNQENIRGLAVSPDGTRVIPASSFPYDLLQRNLQR
jgi:hypothetical protein